MELRELVGRIAQEYDGSLDFSSTAQQLLKAASAELGQWIPAGYVPDASGGLGNAATVPWIAVFDPDETTSAQRGMYVVYLFPVEGQRVYLSPAQGVVDVINREGARAGRELLQREAAAIRDALHREAKSTPEAALPAVLGDLVDGIDLGSRQGLPRSYEAGTVLAREYAVSSLPPEPKMVEHLRDMVRLYQAALHIAKPSAHPQPTSSLPPQCPARRLRDSLSSSPKAIQIIYNRSKLGHYERAENTRRSFGNTACYMHGQGFEVATNVHPRDLLAERNEKHWLIEAKIVVRGNGVTAARDALGQLMFYRRFLYEDAGAVSMLALFNESIGDACVIFLEELGIASVWSQAGRWHGSPSALRNGLC